MYRGKYEAGARRQGAETPARQPRKAPASNKNEKKKTSVGTVIFYSLYFLMIGAACVAMWFGLDWLESWLMDFEASQPDAKCQEVFDRYFADPDWGEVYELLEPDAVRTMPQEAFTTYMETKVGSRELTYSKTSAGLSGGRKYILRLGEENLGTFTLMNDVVGELEIPDWKLSDVEIFVSAREYVTVQTELGNSVAVNGQVLDESYIIKTTSTVAEEYLPDGIHGRRTATYYIAGLLNAPQVTVTDPSGAEISMEYHEDQRLYTHGQSAQPAELSKEQYDFVLEATKMYFRFMLDKASTGQLRDYFDSDSDTYKTIVKSEDPWLQDFKTYEYGQEKIYEFYAYSEDLFSVRIAMDLNVTRTNGTIKTFSVDTAFFAQRQGKSWKIIEMTNVDVNQVLTQVRMQYMQDDKVLASQMVSTDVTVLETPNVVAPEGKTFSGWFSQSVDEKGNTTYSLVFQTDEESKVKLPANYALEPMTLYALFGEGK